MLGAAFSLLHPGEQCQRSVAISGRIRYLLAGDFLFKRPEF